MNMAENIIKILYDVLMIFYQSFGVAVLFAVVFMFVYKNNSGLKEAVKKWLMWFKSEKQFRRVFYFAFYTAIVLFCTLFDRTLFDNPLSNVLGEWAFYEDVNGKPAFNANVPENISA